MPFPLPYGLRKIWGHPAQRDPAGRLELGRCLRPGDLCADIGANVGIYTLLMARYAGAGSVHAFECLPSNLPKLQANLELNGYGDPTGVLVHPVALADRDGVFNLNVSDGDATASITPFENSCTNSSAAQVQARCLDGFSWPGRLAHIKAVLGPSERMTTCWLFMPALWIGLRGACAGWSDHLG